MTATTPQSKQRGRHWLIALALIALTATAFWPVRHCRFVVYDDDLYVTNNPAVHDGLTMAGAVWAFTTDRTGNYHPLTWLSLMADAQFFGTGAAGFHRTNVAIHALNVVLLFLVLAAMTGATWRSALVAALFAVHPLRVESVVWISERKDVLSSCLGLLALLAYVRYARGPSFLRYTLVLGLLTVSLLAKPMLVTFPFLLLLLDYWPLRRWRLGIHRVGIEKDKEPNGVEIAIRGSGSAEGVARFSEDSKPRLNGSPERPNVSLAWLALEKVPLCLLVVIFSVAAFLTQRSSGAIVTLDYDSPAHRLATALIAYARYVEKIFWPVGLTMPYPLQPHWPVWLIAASAAGLAMVTALAIAQYHRRPWLIVGWLWFLGTLVPVIGLVQIGPQAMADRYTYFPAIGLLIMVVWSVPEPRRLAWSTGAPDVKPRGLSGVPRVSAIMATCAATALLLTCVILTRQQINYWRDSNALLHRSLAVAGTDWVAYNHVGSVYLALHEYGPAAEAFRQAVVFDPANPQTHVNLGNALAAEGQARPAYAEFQAALALDGRNLAALRSMGRLLATYHRRDEAVAYYEKILRLAPDDQDARKQIVEWPQHGAPTVPAKDKPEKKVAGDLSE